ncbi:hypothetical protein KRX54_00075 [Actinomycetaceae bacterium TAE3-ERU4]|nr:hypothetical protein [Actinomycetaceae bacterium TAE3-ERU4]
MRIIKADDSDIRGLAMLVESTVAWAALMLFSEGCVYEDIRERIGKKFELHVVRRISKWPLFPWNSLRSWLFSRRS